MAMRILVLAIAVAISVGWASQAGAQDMAQATAPAPGSVFRDCPDCPQLVVVPAGSFVMGTAAREVGRGRDEGPAHRVAIAAFALGRSHVTRAQFAAFVQAAHYQASGGCNEFHADRVPPYQWQLNPQLSWQSPGFAQADDHPVVCVSFDDAQAYVRWLAQQTSHAYRLPSEAEWEYAARAGTTTARFWGDSQEGACQHARVADDQCRDARANTVAVASYAPNQFGLYDMLGNAWQWVEDCYHDSYVGAPTDGRAWTAGDCQVRVSRGGAWNVVPRNVRAGLRARDPSGSRGPYAGFRVARALSP
jgi:formylglycine-generating enzyme required for sulfatase activity